MTKHKNYKTIQPLSESDVEWKNGAPIATEYDDIYFSVDNGLEESSFVFLKGIGAPDIWHDKSLFVIGETGFGTGLNFLNTWREWNDNNIEGRLTFISVEAMPLSRESLKKAHASFPEIHNLSDQLIQNWPPTENGQHVRHFENGRITLILLFGFAGDVLSKLDAKIDAWYLDGFAPSKNPDMWNDTVFDNLARLSKPDTKLATFTAAGFVKRGLIERGFDVKKTPGYGRKRERLIGTYCGKAEIQPNIDRKLLPDWSFPALPKLTGKIAIVGAGIAGSMTAHALSNRGRDITVFRSPDQKAASDIPAAILAPRIARSAGAIREFQVSAYSYALSHPVLRRHLSRNTSLSYLPYSSNELEKNKKLNDTLHWGEGWHSFNNDILTFEQSGTVHTQDLIADLLSQSSVKDEHIKAIKPHGNFWKISTKYGKEHVFDIVIIASGSSAPLHSALPDNSYTYSSGQVEILSTDKLDLPDKILSFGEHISASIRIKSEKQNIRVLGSSFNKLSSLPQFSITPSANITENLINSLESNTHLNIDDTSHLSSWTGIRTNTPDFLPIVGGVPDWEKCNAQYSLLQKDALTRHLGRPTYIDGLFMITGFGSKGYQYAPLLSEYLACQVCGEPSPISYTLWRYLSPYRFNARTLIRS
jgi:tRNA 5-methylaminomethyl-2-thiouridine biosynthesis bifunctional protein